MALDKNGIDLKAIERDQKAIDALPNRGRVVTKEKKKEVAKKMKGVPKNSVGHRLEHLRRQIRKEKISYGEIAELQGLKKHLKKGDVELREWAGIPEHE